MKLFCLPYAGGSSVTYNNWKRYINPGIKFCPVELAGRGKRFGEPLKESIEEMVDDVYEQIKGDIEDDTYAIYGHSMGSIIAYELALKLKKENKSEPKHIFFSGYKAANIVNGERNLHKLPIGEFKSKLIELGGTPKELFDNKELCDMFMPIIRADFKAVETYDYDRIKHKLDANISILYGNKEKIAFDEIMMWKENTSGEAKIHSLEGDHFFINSNAENIANIINDTLLSAM